MLPTPGGNKKMGKITVINNISLDGVMQAPGGKEEDTRENFPHGGWTAPYQDQVIGKKMGGMMASGNGSLLLGKRTYEHFYSYWPKQKTNPITDHLNKVRKYVVSTTLREPLPWENSTLLKENVIETITNLKQQEDLAILGSGELIQSLRKNNLIDTYVLLIFPILLGTGRRLFPNGEYAQLKLVDSVVSATGVILATYQA
jgi:dihydrofolate reductase